MKKKFLVEIDYDELAKNIKEGINVLDESGVRIALEDNFIDGFIKCNSIKSDYKVNVKEIKDNKTKEV